MFQFPHPPPHLAAFRRGSTGWLVLNRPERRNALSAEMWRAIPALVQRFSDDVNVRSIALDSFAALQGCRKPALAVIDGYCIGGGLALALACDIRIASNRSIFALPPARLGLAYPRAGLSQLLAAVSAASAKELLFTARRIEAAEALRIGLVHAVVAPGSLLAEASSSLAMIEANAPLSIAAAKGMVNALSGARQSAGGDQLQALADACFESDDYKEGRRAFLEKRPPNFSGR